jgi:UrcA family protein
MKILLPAAILAVALAAGPACAAPLTETYQAQVSYADLNLDNAVGQSILQRRIQAGAKQACGERSIFEVNRFEEVDSCQQRFIETAREQVRQARRSA